MRLRILSLALLGCAFCAAAVAQVAAPLAFADPAPPALETISKNIDEVRLVLTVADKHGKFIKGLGPADLAIYDAGRSVDKLTFFGAESELPLRMAVLVDVSGSMFAQFGFERRLAEDGDEQRRPLRGRCCKHDLLREGRLSGSWPTCDQVERELWDATAENLIEAGDPTRQFLDFDALFHRVSFTACGTTSGHTSCRRR